MKKLIQNIKMAGLMAMALIAWPTTITAQSAKYDAKTVNAVTERFVAYAKINSQGTDTSHGRFPAQSRTARDGTQGGG